MTVVSGTPELRAEDMGADININGCFPEPSGSHRCAASDNEFDVGIRVETLMPGPVAQHAKRCRHRN